MLKTRQNTLPKKPCQNRGSKDLIPQAKKAMLLK